MAAYAVYLASERPSPASGPNGSREPERPRKVIHIDMDAFFASVEQRDSPACAVGLSPSGAHTSGAWWRLLPTRPAALACARPCRPSWLGGSVPI